MPHTDSSIALAGSAQPVTMDDAAACAAEDEGRGCRAAGRGSPALSGDDWPSGGDTAEGGGEERPKKRLRQRTKPCAAVSREKGALREERRSGQLRGGRSSGAGTPDELLFNLADAAEMAAAHSQDQRRMPLWRPAARRPAEAGGAAAPQLEAEATLQEAATTAAGLSRPGYRMHDLPRGPFAAHEAAWAGAESDADPRMTMAGSAQADPYHAGGGGLAAAAPGVATAYFGVPACGLQANANALSRVLHEHMEGVRTLLSGILGQPVVDKLDPAFRFLGQKLVTDAVAVAIRHDHTSFAAAPGLLPLALPPAQSRLPPRPPTVAAAALAATSKPAPAAAAAAGAERRSSARASVARQSGGR